MDGVITKEQLLIILRALGKSKDPDQAHGDADEALLSFIGDPEITYAYNEIKRWYS